jgi:hypothetical protein
MAWERNTNALDRHLGLQERYLMLTQRDSISAQQYQAGIDRAIAWANRTPDQIEADNQRQKAERRRLSLLLGALAGIGVLGVNH